MSNVTVNGNMYNDVASIRLMKADGSGYAEYMEGAAAVDSTVDNMLATRDFGSIEGENAGVYLGWMRGFRFGTVSFPYATTASGEINSCTLENLFLPSVVGFSVAAGNGVAANTMSVGITNCKIPGVLDLSSLTTSMNSAMKIGGCTIGTLKFGTYMPTNWGGGTTITNAIMPGFTANFNTLYFKTAVTIENLYVPADVVEHVRSLIADGTLTKITNVYSIDEWED